MDMETENGNGNGNRRHSPLATAHGLHILGRLLHAGQRED